MSGLNERAHQANCSALSKKFYCRYNSRLYNACLDYVVSTLDGTYYEMLCLPVNVQLDLYREMFMRNKWSQLNSYLRQLVNFIYLLVHNRGQRQTLHMMVQRLMDEGYAITAYLSSTFVNDVSLINSPHQPWSKVKLKNENGSNCESDDLIKIKHNECPVFGFNSLISNAKTRKKAQIELIKNGYALAGFLMEAGWYVDAEKILTSCIKCTENVEYKDSFDSNKTTSTCSDHNNDDLTLEALLFRVRIRLLGSLVSYSRFKEAMSLYEFLLNQIEVNGYEKRANMFDVALAYNQFASLFAAQSLYKEVYKWSCLALKHVSPSTPKLSLIEIFITTGRSCIIKRDFESADYLLKQALLVSKDLFNFKDKEELTGDVSRFHPKFGDLLIALGYYYHNIDIPIQSVKLFELALIFRKQYFGPHTPVDECINIPLALAHQDLAFAYYIQEYSTGRFELCLNNIELARVALESLLPANHHILANVKRTKALILEEIAIDHHDTVLKTKMLLEAQELHSSALGITKSLLGEENVQTAKHYANLGRLYQSMHRYEDSEAMQLRAIEIKEKCLGKDDYEVAQSYGYLASLYSYDMELYPQAETYYLKTIDIGIKSFGEAYSGLEFEYQGLFRIYTHLGDTEKTEKFLRLLRQWKTRRDAISSYNTKKDPFACLLDDESLFDLEAIKQHFYANRIHQI